VPSELTLLLALLVLLACRLWSLPVALITAELATAMPDASGFLLWSRRAFGPFISFLDAWIMIVVVIIDQALYPLIFVSYIETLGPSSPLLAVAVPTPL
jgi:amino acid transporter